MVDALAIIGRLKEAAGAKTDAALARELGITRGSVALWKKNNNVPLHHAISISERYSVSLDWLITGLDNSTKPQDDFFVALSDFPAPDRRFLSIAIMEFTKLNNLSFARIEQNDPDTIAKQLAAFYELTVVRYAELSHSTNLSHEEKISILRRPFEVKRDHAYERGAAPR